MHAVVLHATPDNGRTIWAAVLTPEHACVSFALLSSVMQRSNIASVRELSLFLLAFGQLQQPNIYLLTSICDSFCGRFFSHNSSYVHGGIEKPGEEQLPVKGQAVSAVSQ